MNKSETLRRNNFYSPCAYNGLACLSPPQRDENFKIQQVMTVTDKGHISDSFNLRPDKTRQALRKGSVIPYILFRPILEPVKSKQMTTIFYKESQICFQI